MWQLNSSLEHVWCVVLSVICPFSPDEEEIPSPPLRAFRILWGPGIPERKLLGSIELAVESVVKVFFSGLVAILVAIQQNEALRSPNSNYFKDQAGQVIRLNDACPRESSVIPMTDAVM